MIRPLWGFWQRFRKMDRSPSGPWVIALFQRKCHAELMRKTGASYSEVGPVFKTYARIPALKAAGGVGK